MTNSITVTDLSIAYRAHKMHARTLKAVVGTLGRSLPVRSWALKDVSFEVAQGEMLGIVGVNGSGKSTLLRCLAGIFRPTEGRVEVRGRAANLIDLTAGLHMDLSVRDNMHLAGAIYGVPRAVMDERLEEILAFAGLEEHVDNPLRSFSTGMALRLGFALAVSMEPDVILVDEVLAVGDEWFKTRCLDRIESLRKQGSTVVFASHELGLIRGAASRVIVLEGGKIAADTDPASAVDLYCERLGLSLDEVMERSPLEPFLMERVGRPWARRR
jgi:ABC-type polysaccharide/polyol phosphate transport system ATPase subunit